MNIAENAAEIQAMIDNYTHDTIGKKFMKTVTWERYIMLKEQFDTAIEVLDILMPFLYKIESQRAVLKENITLLNGDKINSGNVITIISPDELFSVMRSVSSKFNKKD